MSGHDDPTVCVAHGRFIPCRKDGEHRYTANPYWVKAVRDYQSSTVGGLTWEPAWPSAPATDHPCGDTTCDECRPELHDCGYVEDSFACRIRHQSEPIIRWGRASKQ